MKRRTRWILCAYLVALGLSHLVRRGGDERPLASAPTEHVAAVRAVAGDARTEATIGLFHRRLQPPAGPSAAAPGWPLVLLHGSPGSGGDLERLATELARERPVVVPDLPGFGRSRETVPDYSIRAHADYVLQLLDQLGHEAVHVVGFSMGGGVALELAERAPERVASLTLLSAIGVVELELFGNQRLNHLVHGGQRLLLALALEGVPHFGLLDNPFLTHAYARNFHDTDQTPLRGILERYAGPLLVLHGREDSLVPLAAAREHARIVPQAELELFPRGHFLVFQEPAAVAGRIDVFLERVESGAAATRATAAPERLAAARRPFDPASVPPLAGLALAVFSLAVVLATFVSEDLACLGVGALVGQGRVAFLPGTLACLVGITVGDVLLFWAGRTLGRRALGRAPWSWFLSEDRFLASSRWFEARGPVVILISRLIPGTRLPTYFAAGALRTSFPRFLGWFLLASALWTPLVVWIAAQVGGELLGRLELFQRHLLTGLLATLALGFVLIRWVVPLFTARGRRLRRVSLRRLLHWEYWPLWLFYLPVALRVLWWTVRRGGALFTAANPAMPHGGFVGESKGAILRALARGSDAVPPTATLPARTSPAERLARVDAFLAEHGLALPVVVKPDVGERGTGVHVCRDRATLEAAVGVRPDEELLERSLSGVPLLIQAYVPGREFGLFYARHPDEPRGRILSITEKHLPLVTGDGEHTVEELIFADERASMSAHVHLAHFGGSLERVPAAGERVPLGELGTHCRGATFLDGAEHRTSALEEAVERVSRGMPGFFFGRFDVRAESVEDLRAGRFQVLELNGVTSEMTHIYDPRYSVGHGWRTITNQWRMAFDIGAANAARGAPVSTLGQLARAVAGGDRTAAAETIPETKEMQSHA